MSLLGLAKLKYFFEQLGIKFIEPLNFRKKFQIQKSAFILNELGKIKIFDLIEKENDFLWYIRGVYSHNIAQAYHSIELNKQVLNTIETTNLVIQQKDVITSSKEFIHNLRKHFDIRTEEKFFDFIELYSSLLFLQNYKHISDLDSIWNFLINEKPHLKEYRSESKELFNSWMKLP